ncbi:MAG: hypothetical protein AB1898_10450 [Acidobacteriota bacterium]
MRRKWMALLVGATIGLGILLQVDTGAAQKGKTRLAKTKYLMRGINQPACAGLGASLKDSGPADDKAWDVAVGQAALLNEAGYLLMDDGRCPDQIWAGAAKDLREGSSSALAALEKKDLEGARTAFKTITASCATCHKAHKQ